MHHERQERQADYEAENRVPVPCAPRRAGGPSPPSAEGRWFEAHHEAQGTEPQTSTSENKAHPAAREKRGLAPWTLLFLGDVNQTPVFSSWEEILQHSQGHGMVGLSWRRKGGRGPRVGLGPGSTPSGLTPQATAEAAGWAGHSVLLSVSSLALNTAEPELFHGTVISTTLLPPALEQTPSTAHLTLQT